MKPITTEDIKLLADAIDELITAKLRNMTSLEPSDLLREMDSKAALQMVLALVFIEDKS